MDYLYIYPSIYMYRYIRMQISIQTIIYLNRNIDTCIFTDIQIDKIQIYCAKEHREIFTETYSRLGVQRIVKDFSFELCVDVGIGNRCYSTGSIGERHRAEQTTYKKPQKLVRMEPVMWEEEENPVWLKTRICQCR